jgi:hypothetical protein
MADGEHGFCLPDLTCPGQSEQEISSGCLLVLSLVRIDEARCGLDDSSPDCFQPLSAVGNCGPGRGVVAGAGRLAADQGESVAICPQRLADQLEASADGDPSRRGPHARCGFGGTALAPGLILCCAERRVARACVADPLVRAKAL